MASLQMLDHVLLVLFRILANTSYNRTSLLLSVYLMTQIIDLGGVET